MRKLKIEELIKWLEKCSYLQGFDNDGWCGSVELCGEDVRGIVDALKRADKYKWHDIRKNPNDLPNMGYSVVYVWTKNRLLDCCVWDEDHGFRPWYATDEIYIPEDAYDPGKDIIKWRLADVPEDSDSENGGVNADKRSAEDHERRKVFDSQREREDAYGQGDYGERCSCRDAYHESAGE